MRPYGDNSVANVLAIALFAVALLAPVDVSAHEARPVVLDVSQASDRSVVIELTAPGTLDWRMKPRAILPSFCDRLGSAETFDADGNYLFKYQYQCSEELSGKSIGIDFPYGNPSLSTLVLASLPNGESHTKLLLPGNYTWRLPVETTATVVAKDYTVLGINHIWRGLDHLLFVLCLLFIARTKWRILATITGFTVAHSLTLALAVLGYLNLSIGAVEAVIALSIVFLAAEILRANRDSFAWRKPMAVAVIFGLLHGLGFASVLADIGLPQSHQTKALLFFNVGVEIGQVLFIGTVFLVLTLVRNVPMRLTTTQFWSHLRPATLYLIGITSSFWFIERSVSAWT